MKFSYPPLSNRIFNVLLRGGIVLLMSCQSDPIILNPPGGYEYIRQTFPLDSLKSFSVQGEAHTGYSPRLYSGKLKHGEAVSILIKLKPEVLDSHQVCNAETIFDATLELISTFPLTPIESSPYDITFIDTLLLNIYLINLNEIQDNEMGEDVILDSNQVANLIVDTKKPIKFDLSSKGIKLKLFDYDIITHWCNNQDELGIVISYSPVDSSYLEFYSSDGSNVSLGPQLLLEYSAEEEVLDTTNLYSFNSVTWSGDFINLDSGPYYVNNPVSDDWGTFYAMDLNLDAVIISNPSTFYDSIKVQSEILSPASIDPSTLLQINVDMIPEIINDIDSLTFFLTYAVAFRSDFDLAGDNQTVLNPDSTEANGNYDWGELFYDYGTDNCPDSLETGDDEDSCGTTISVYNSDGTEGNGVWDEGEDWNDHGIDGCKDEWESGDGGCDNIGGISDLNEDNYNIDPIGDDWSSVNLNGTEGNGIWNEGEPYQDWGTDGLHALMIGGVMDANKTEGNGMYDIGELFYDTGEDGLFNEHEDGYNSAGTEGNGQFDGDGELNDHGIDGCKDEWESGDGGCDNIGGISDLNEDNYNIDPNNDNWSTDSTFSQDNGLLDEGEQWFDWGTDQIPDSLESFHESVILIPNHYENEYIYNFTTGFIPPSPTSNLDTVNLWISNIQKDGNALMIDISIQSNVDLKGLQFQLSHIPHTRIETKLKSYEVSFAQIGTEKLFEDLSLLPKKMYSEEELKGKLLIDYANDVTPLLDFDNINLFLEDGNNIISHTYSNLILYVDLVNTNLYDNIEVSVAQENGSGEDVLLSLPIIVSSLDDSITIPMGHVFSAYQSGKLEINNKYKLKTSDNLYNYSQLSIKNNSRLDIMYTK